jgi:signal peptidase II
MLVPEFTDIFGMKARFLISAIILVASILLDQITKLWGTGLKTLHYNEGVIMGFYSTLPDSIRIVALATFSGIVFFLYVIMLYLIPARGKWLKYGLSAMVGGMFGNVIDKIRLGKTIDFIPFNFASVHTVFNLADCILWAGMGIVVYMLLRHDHLIWHPESTRGSLLIRPKEQFKVALNLTLVVFCSSLVLGIFSFTFFRTTFFETLADKDHVMLTFFITYALMTVFFCVLTFSAGILISHKSAGPLHAFENYVNDLINGSDRRFTLRDGDNYRDLEQVAQKLREHLKKPE